MHILNKKASFEYEFTVHFECGIVLLSSEIKSIRSGKVSIKEAYLTYKFPHIYIYNMYIGEYKNLEHETRRDRIILLNQNEKNKVISKIKLKGMSFIPIELYFNKKGFAKIKCSLGFGKKLHDKRKSIKEKELRREKERLLKQ